MIKMKKKKKNINGVVLLNKDKKFFLNKILNKIKNNKKIEKYEYVSNLDPLTTGILPICFGKSLNFSKFIINSNKKYHIIIKLGEYSDDEDDYNNYIYCIDYYFLKNENNNFRNYILHYIFKKMMDKCYNNNSNMIKKKDIIKIYSVELIKFKDNFIELMIHCSKGTSIRSIINKIQKKIRHNIYIKFIKIIRLSYFLINNTIELKYFYEKIYKKNKICNIKKTLLPIDTAVSNLPILNIDHDLSKFLIKGNKVLIKKNIRFLPNNMYRITTDNQKKFIGVFELEYGYIIPNKFKKNKRY
ncbi:tRNA pseudouridine synthase B [Candidatus Annandia pinicola]|nr:tRNA pseudouridine synthase B [Candidatus Annandia pinicola]